MHNFPSFSLEQYSSEFLLVKQSSLYNLLNGVTTVQQALEILDSKLVEASESTGGLMSQSDKALLDWLGINASEKIYVYSNQEEAGIDPTTKIVIADNEGLTFLRESSEKVRIGLRPFYDKVMGSDDSATSATIDDKNLKFGATKTTDVIVVNNKVYVDATKTLQAAFMLAIIFGG